MKVSGSTWSPSWPVMMSAAVRSMTFDMLGMSLMAPMVLLVIGGGTTWA